VPAAEEKAIADVAVGMGTPLSSGQAEAMLRFFTLLLSWNERINLTGARSLATLIEEHLPDSLALARLVPQGGRVVDVGSGGGLPALPFAVVRPDVSLALVEPRAKRVAFLRTAVRELGLEVAIYGARVEDLALGEFDVACSCATFPPVEWWGLGRGLVRTGGQVVLFLARPHELAGDLPAPSQRLDYRAGGKPRTALALPVSRETT
jgi:16S rRNA (guanine527-N7)-methyltransferase